MPNEKIEVRYKTIPYQSADEEPRQWYHKYIVYTDSTGQEYYARGGFELDFPPEIDTEYGEYTPDTIDYPDVGTDPSETIADAPDLSDQWNAIKAAMDEIEAQNLYYNPGRNSNSVVDTALDRAGLPQPEQDGRGEYETPGSGNILPPASGNEPSPPIPGHKPPVPTDTITPPIPGHKPDYVPGVEDGVGDAARFTCPLVLDLGSVGVNLTSVDGPGSVYWDIDNDGFAEVSSWVGPQDGLLAVDSNGDGFIGAHSELFGNATQGGFSALSSYDSNGDSSITSADTQFNSLLVWVDASSDGYSQTGELHSLTALGITSINLNATAVSYEISGNPITAQSTFTMGGQVRQIVDASFAFDNVNTVYNQNYVADERALYLPTVRGYGVLPDLYIAMSLNETLLNKVYEVASVSVEDLVDPAYDLENRLEAILFEWAGVTNMDPDGRGGQMTDDRKLEFLEEFLDIEYRQAGSMINTVALGALRLDETFTDAYNNIAARLLAQTSMGELLGAAKYDTVTDTLVGFAGLNTTFLTSLEALADVATEPLYFWQQIVMMVDYTVGISNLSTADGLALESAISNTTPGVDLSDVAQSIIFEGIPTPIYGTESSETLTGDASNDIIYGYGGNDRLEGGIGVDELRGGEGDDTLVGGYGDDGLFGDQGDDTYHYEYGQDNIDEGYNVAGNVDKIVFRSGIVLSDLTFTRTNDYNLSIKIAGGGGLMVFDQFEHGKSVERLVFADGSTFDLTQFETATEGTIGNDTLIGRNLSMFSHDVIKAYDGNDSLDGGAGDDRLFGGYGDDNYIITAGLDRIWDDGGNDKITFGPAYNKNNIEYKVVDNYHLDIFFNGVLTAHIDNQFGGSGIETIQFSDASTVDLTTKQFEQRGDNTDNYLYGVQSGGSKDNLMFGESGNDYLYAGEGNDTLNGGAGLDTLDGGQGDDVYMISTSSGLDTIYDYSGNDEILLGAGFTQGNMTFKRINDVSLEISFSGTDVAQVSNFFYTGSGYGVETIRFSDNSTFNLTPYQNVVGSSGNNTLTGLDNTLLQADYIYGYEGNDSLSGGAGSDRLMGGADNDTYTYTTGGDIVQDESGAADQITFSGASYLQANMTLVRADNYNLNVLFNGVLAVMIENQFTQNGAIETLKFNDDSTLNLLTYSHLIEGTSVNDSLYGNSAGAGGDIIKGYDGNDYIYADAGDDTLEGGNGDDYLDGGTGNDTFKISSGLDTVRDSGGTADIIIFGPGYSQSNMTLVRDGYNDLKISFGGVHALTISGQFSADGKIETLKFNDLSTFDLSTVSYTVTGTNSAETLYGIGFGGNPNDTISALGGDDYIYAFEGNDTITSGNGNDYVSGGLGNDIYNYASGSGVDTLIDEGGADKIVFGAGFSTSNMTLEKINSYDLKISFGGAHVITIQNQFYDNGVIETLEFSGGSTYNLAGIQIETTGTSSGETLNGTNSVSAIDSMHAFGGDDTINAYRGNDLLYGQDGDDTLNAGEGADVLDGGAGTDLLNGGEGDDSYVFGNGADTIQDATGVNGGTDSILFGTGVTLANLNIRREVNTSTDNNHLVVSDGSGNSIRIENQFGSSAAPVEKLKFADGSETLISSLQIATFGDANGNTLNGIDSGASVNDSLYGNAGNDSLNGYAGNDYLEGGTDYDNMYGGTGDDTYAFAPGFGIATTYAQDYVSENLSEGFDTVLLTGGILPENMRMWTDSNGRLYIRLTANPDDQVMFEATNTNGSDISSRIERISFSGITTWDLTQGLPLKDTDQAHSLYGSAQNDTIDGQGGNDQLTGYAGNDTLIGGTGYDTLYGGQGDDTYVFAPGFGITTTYAQDYVSENIGEGTDAIFIGGGLQTEDVRTWTDSNGRYYIRFVANPDDQVMLEATNSAGSDIGSRIEKIVFETGAIWNLSQGLLLTDTDDAHSLYGSAQNDIIDGRGGNDQITGYAGNDTLVGGAGYDTLYGNEGDDTYVFAPGFGITTTYAQDYVSENIGEGTDTIRIQGGLTPNDVRTWTDSNGRYYIRFTANPDDQLMLEATNTNGSDIGSRVEKVVFDNGVTWNLSQGLLLTDTDEAHNIYGSAQTDIIDARDGNDSITGYDGNDIIIGGAGYDNAYGGLGNDTYVFSNGFGIAASYSADYVSENLNEGTDTILFTGGLTLNDLSMWTDSNGRLHIRLASAEDEVMFEATNNNGSDIGDKLEKITFDNLSSLDLTQGLLLNDAADGHNIYGSRHNDTIDGKDGNDSITGYAGNDVITGGAGYDNVYGGTGNDTYVFNPGFGIAVSYSADYVSENLNEGLDTIRIGGGLTANDIRTWTDSNGRLHVRFSANAEDEVMFEASSTNGSDIGQRIEQIVFDSAPTIDLTQGLTLNDTDDGHSITGSALGDTISGNGGADSVTGYAGNDVISGGAGNDNLYGNEGNDVIDGGADDDYMDGGDGIDHLTYASAASAVTVNLATTSQQTTGGAGNDTVANFENLTGSAFNDTLTGDTNANVIEGGAGNDTLNGDAGSDTASYGGATSAVTVNLATVTAQNTVGAGTDTLTAFENLIGSAFNDTLTGDGNANIIEGGAGNDAINGAGGTDTASYAGATAGVTVNLATATAQNTVGAGTDTITNTENVTGSSFNDTLTGTTGANVIEGGLGNDVMDGSTGTDTVSYTGSALGVTVNLATTTAQNTVGAGTDTLTGFENLTGSAFNDMLTGDANANTIDGGAGADVIEGGNGNDVLTGGLGTDRLTYISAAAAVTVNLATVTSQNTGGAGSDTITGFENLTGSAFNDTLTGDGADNVIEGGAGNDTINGAGGLDTTSYSTAPAAVTVNLATATAQNTVGAGTDTITNTENLVGSAFNDTLTGSTAANVIDGGAGNDVIDGGAGDDTLVGGTGIDRLNYAAAASAITLDLSSTSAQTTGGSGNDTVSGFENLTGSAFNDTLTGDTGNNVIEGGAGNDTINGADGIDTASYAGASAAVTVNLATVTAQNTVGAGSDTLSNLENLIGSAFNDTLTGTSGNNVIEGGAGNDTINGGSGTDTASYAGATAGVTVNLSTTTAQNTVGAGTDTLTSFENVTGSAFNDALTGTTSGNVIEGGDGNDTIDGAAGTDTLSYASASAGVTVNLSTTTAQNTVGAGTDTVTNMENVTGSAFNDTLTGTSGNNVIDGGDGADTIQGGAGADTMLGGNGLDVLTYAAATSAVTVSLALTTAQSTGGGGTDTISGLENLTGTGFNDTLSGDAFNNVIDGANGNDTIFGDDGDDTLTAGAGTDTANYSNVGAGVVVNLATTTAQNTVGAGSDTLTGFENLTGSAFNDTLTGDANANVITGGNGNDLVEGGVGNDTLTGGNGIDRLSYAASTAAVTVNLATTTSQNTGGAGSDTVSGFENLTGSGFNDTLTGDTANNAIDGGNGNDVIQGGEGNDILTGGSGTDTATYAAAATGVTVSLGATSAQNTVGAGIDILIGLENLTGSAFDDILTGDANANTVDGGNGNDVVEGGAGTDTLIGGAGTDRLSYASASAAVTVNLATLTAQNTVGAGTDTISGFENLTGSAFNDTLTGDGNANVIEGGLGNDAINGAGGSDTVSYVGATAGVTVNLATTTGQNTVGAGTDTITNTENLTGSAFNDTLTGDANANVIDAGAGDDVVQGGAGDDTMIGGLGVDRLTYAASASGVTINLSTMTAQATVGAGLDTISGFENLTGSAFDDTLTGNINANVIEGGAGNDVISGSLGVDTLTYANAASAVTMNLGLTTAQATGGAGSDTVTGFENLIGSGFNDILTGGADDNQIDGGNGNDTIEGGAGTDVLIGGAGTDILTYSTAAVGVTVSLALTTAQNTLGVGIDTVSGFENLTGSGFNDNLKGDGNANVIDGGAGMDVIEGGAGNDTLTGGSGTDTASYLGAASAVTVNLATLTAQNTVGAGTDTLAGFENLIGSAFNDTLTGDGNANVIEGGAGNDTLNGAAGTDTVAYISAASAVTVNLATSTAQNTVGAGSDTLSGFENLTGSAFGDILTGDANANTIDGGSGDDIIEGGAGNDTLKGNAGFDTVRYASATAAVTVSLALTTGQNTGGAGTDTLSSFSNLIGSGFNDTLTGDGFSNVIEGGAGNDTMNGGSGSDTASYVGAASAVTVNLATATAQNTVGAGTDTLTSFENLRGSAFNDTLTGDGNGNIIEGGAGNDTMDGAAGTDTVSYEQATAGVTVSIAVTTAQNTVGAGTDTLSNFERIMGSAFNDTLTGNSGSNLMEGGAGNDTMDGSTGTDTVTYNGASAAVTVSLAVTTAQNTVGAGTDTLTNFEGLTGSKFNDDLTGNSGANTLRGNDGNDRINGLGGADTLYGELGADTFYYDASALGTTDTIADFSIAQGDILDIADMLVGYSATQSAIDDFVTFTTVGSNTTMSVDRDGTASTYAAQAVASITGVTGLDADTLLTNGQLLAV